MRFEAAAFVDGGFKNIKLSDYQGKWVVLCFHVRATGEVAPADWRPGKPTLKPNPDLVGNVWKV